MARLTPTFDRLLAAIVDDDQRSVKKLLSQEPGLTKLTFKHPILYREKILHWLYVGDTASHLAAAGYRVEIVQQLLVAGADPNFNDNHRHATPLHYAADGYVNGVAWNPKRQVKTIEILLEAGSEINAQDKNGATPLHRAVRTRCADAVRFLLKAGADAARRNKPGSTPFHLAVQNTGRGGSGSPEAIAGQREIIQAFLSVGISPGTKSASGKTVRDSAQSEWIRDLIG
jgi:ankyrin repeat protein